MRSFGIYPSLIFSLGICSFSQTAEELVNNNIKAKGGMEKIKAIQTVRMTGKFSGQGIIAVVDQKNMRPEKVRETMSIQGMSAVQVYDGSIAWQINPFGGRKDPQLTAMMM